MTNLINKITKLAMIPILAGGLFIGLNLSLQYINKGLEKIENSEYIKNFRKEQKEKREFQEKYLSAVKENKVTYTHCGKNLPLWFVDIDGDKNQDGYLLHVVGSTRGSNDIGLYKINQNKK